jgi:hypothetical protein
MQYDNKIAQAGKGTIQSDSTESNLLSLTRNMSDGLQVKVNTKLESEEEINILIVGSNAIMSAHADNLPWPLQVEIALEDNYGENTFHVEVMNFENITTNHLIETMGHEQIAEKQADILIIEPLLLNDNGFVKVEDTLRNLEKIINLVKQINPETHIIVQPSNPIHEPITYLEQVSALEEFTSKNNIEYLNHWHEWPDTSSDNIKDVLEESFPNASGHDIWANYFINYLIAKKNN